jgi:hypothetical protein
MASVPFEAKASLFEAFAASLSWSYEGRSMSHVSHAYMTRQADILSNPTLVPVHIIGPR